MGVEQEGEAEAAVVGRRYSSQPAADGGRGDEELNAWARGCNPTAARQLAKAGAKRVARG